MKGSVKPGQDLSIVNFAQADIPLGQTAALSAFNVAATDDARPQTALPGQGILGKRPAPMTDVPDEPQAKGDLKLKDHEHLEKYTVAREPDFLQLKRRRLSALTQGCLDQSLGNATRSPANHPASAGALESVTELRDNIQPRQAGLTGLQA